MSADKKLPIEWAYEMGYTILDPDGWRGKDDPPFDEPLTLAEFYPRFAISTVGALPKQPDPVPCVFDKAWVGRCKQPSVRGTEFCADHVDKKCKARVRAGTCGYQAVKDCEATIGAFVCGMPLCAECRCH